MLWLPSWLTTLILIVSPRLPVIGGLGHCPLMPTYGRVNPSGAALTHPMFQLYVMSFPTGIDGVHAREGVTVDCADVDVLEETVVDVLDVEVVRGDDVEEVLEVDEVDVVVFIVVDDTDDEVEDELEEELEELESTARLV